MKVVAIVAVGLLGLGSTMSAQNLGAAASQERVRRQALSAQTHATAPAAVGRRALYIPRDEYPAVALSRHIEGLVDLVAFVDEGGSVLDVQLSATDGYRPFREAADRSVRVRRHSPLLDNGAPVKGWIPIRAYFRLD